MNRIRNQRGAALLETAITLPLVLAVSIAIFEFGRAYQAWQVLTNASREGARLAILADTSDADVTSAVKTYLTQGRLKDPGTATITVQRAVAFTGSKTASKITVSYPFNFVVLNPVMKLLNKSSKVGSTTTMEAVTLMRNES